MRPAMFLRYGFRRIALVHDAPFRADPHYLLQQSRREHAQLSKPRDSERLRVGVRWVPSVQTLRSRLFRPAGDRVMQ